MVSNVIAFPSRMDVVTATLRLLALDRDATAPELLDKHARLAGVLSEAHAQEAVGRTTHAVVAMIAQCHLGYDALAHACGVAPGEIEAFNAEREDWWAWVEAGAARRAGRRSATA